MKSFVKNIEEIAFKNEDFCQVLYTANNCRLVMMALKPKEEIGIEGHKLDQILPMEDDMGEAVLDGVHTKISAGFAVLIPVRTNRNIKTGSASMKLFNFKTPPKRNDGLFHPICADVEKDNEHIDGNTTV